MKTSEKTVGKIEAVEIVVMIRKEDSFDCTSKGSLKIGTKVDWITSKNIYGITNNNPLGYK